MILWNPHTGTKIRSESWTTADGGIRSVAFSPDSRLLAIGTQRFDNNKSKDASAGSLCLLDVSSGIMEWHQAVPGWAKPVAFSADGKTVAVLCGGRSIRLLETGTGRVKHEIQSTDSPKGGRWNDFAIASQSGTLAIGGVDDEGNGSVELWDFGSPDAAANSTGMKRQADHQSQDEASTSAFRASRTDLPAGNFVVYASSRQLAKEIGEAAEKYRETLAVSWFGDPVQDWESPCVIRILEGESIRPNVEFDADDWELSLQAPRRRLIESLLPRGILHALFATRFQQPVPLWSVEGAGITVETPAERAEYDKMLVEFLTSNRGIAFNRLFAMEEHPADYLAMLAQSHSVVQFLVNQHGRRKFVAFLEDGVESKDWPAAVGQHYGFPDLSALQLAWTASVRASHHEK